jgi:hypothetical protein
MFANLALYLHFLNFWFNVEEFIEHLREIGIIYVNIIWRDYYYKIVRIKVNNFSLNFICNSKMD